VAVLAAGGVTAWRFWVILADWRPMLLPPPMRRACASKETESMATADTISMTTASSLEIRRDMKMLLWRAGLAGWGSDACDKA
jgi:hypothetical protein